MRWLTLICLFCLAVQVRADAFDNYTNPVLAKVPEAAEAKPVQELTPQMILDNDQVLPNVKAAMIVVYSNDNRWSKLLVTAARQKIAGPPGSEPIVVPILRIERFATMREASERAILVEGKNISLFPDFHFHLDLGQVVPPKLGGDLSVSEPQPKQLVVKPVGKAKMYLLTKQLPDAKPPKSEKMDFSSGKFDPKFFAGTYKFSDDGRRSGTLRIKVNDENDISGTFVTDLDGREYDVSGSVSKPSHKILFTIKFPRTEEAFEGYMFTGNGKAIAGTSKLEDREGGFYAVRVEE
ncbi:MAG TPA: hypothetical protein VGZ47_04550 [Gemmataceae bacterium]|jgi:hypothetical protein|nr:hypothetical protein [Gemmataceae bacterium]